MKKRTQHEAAIQTNLMRWMELQYPKEFRTTFAIPNGGRRDAREAKNLQRQGTKAGIPDIYVAVPRNGFPGMFLELKTEKGKPTQRQLVMMDRLVDAGYVVVMAKGFEAAKRAIEDYLEPQP